VSDKCKECRGRKTKLESEILEVNIPRGKQPGSRIPFYNKADEAADLEAGDLVVILTPTEDEEGADGKEESFSIPPGPITNPALVKRPKFQRLKTGVDLVIEVSISLIEALLGFRLAFRHLDDRILIVESPPGQVIENETTILSVADGSCALCASSLPHGHPSEICFGCSHAEQIAHDVNRTRGVDVPSMESSSSGEIDWDTVALGDVVNQAEKKKVRYAIAFRASVPSRRDSGRLGRSLREHDQPHAVEMFVWCQCASYALSQVSQGSFEGELPSASVLQQIGRALRKRGVSNKDLNKITTARAARDHPDRIAANKAKFEAAHPGASKNYSKKFSRTEKGKASRLRSEAARKASGYHHLRRRAVAHDSDSRRSKRTSMP
jgi:hypothetical protein